MRRRSCLVLAVAILLLALTLAATTLTSSAPSPAPATTIPAAEAVTPATSTTVGVQVTETSSEVASFTSYEPLWHNTTTTNASNAFTFPANMTLYPSTSSFTATLTVSAGAYLPVLKVSQGTSVLLNSTVTGQVSVTPTASTTPLTVKVLQLFQETGAAVATGTYHVWVNVTETGYLSFSTFVVWAQEPLNFTLVYKWSAPYDFALNQTAVFVPFPSGVSVNYTSVSVANATTPQTAYAGVYAYNTSLAADKSLTFTVVFAPYPIVSGPAVLVTMTKPKLEPGSTTVYTATGNWSNGFNLPYEGIYILSTGFAYTIDPSSVTLVENTITMLASHYTVGNNNTIVVVPGTLTVAKGGGVVFTLTFSSLAAPPEGSVIGTGGVALFPVGTASFTVSDLLLALMLGGALYLAWGVSRYAEGWNRFTAHTWTDRVAPPLRRVLARSLVLMVVTGILYFLVG